MCIKKLNLLVRTQGESTDADQKASNESAPSKRSVDDKTILGKYSLSFWAQPKIIQTNEVIYTAIPNPTIPQCTVNPITKACLFITSVTDPNNAKIEKIILDAVKKGTVSCASGCGTMSNILQKVVPKEVKYLLTNSVRTHRLFHNQ